MYRDHSRDSNNTDKGKFWKCYFLGSKIFTYFSVGNYYSNNHFNVLEFWSEPCVHIFLGCYVTEIWNASWQKNLGHSASAGMFVKQFVADANSAYEAASDQARFNMVPIVSSYEKN